MGVFIINRATSIDLNMVLEVASVAAIRALGAGVDNVVYARGYSNVSDGGQGFFNYVSTDTTSADNGGTIIVDSINHRWYRDTQTEDISVKWFGAKGNGSTDDTAAIQAAINYVQQIGGGTVYLPPGTYVISSALNITVGNVSVRGSNRRASIIATNSTTADAFFIGTSNIYYVAISHMGILASNTQTAGAAIHQSGSVSLTQYTDLNLKGYNGILLESTGSSSICKINNCDIESCSLAGIYLGSTTGQIEDVYVSECNIESCGYGIYLENISGGYFNSIDITNSIDCALQFVPGENESVLFCFFDKVLADTTGNNGWAASPSGNGIVAGITCTSCWAAASGNYGILLNTGGTLNGFSWVNGIIRANGDAGALVVSGSNIIFANNQVFNNSNNNRNSFSGLQFYGGVSYLDITGNISGDGGYDQAAGGSNLQEYGISIGAGPGSHIVVANNVCSGNITGGVYNGATGANVTVVNNVS